MPAREDSGASTRWLSCGGARLAVRLAGEGVPLVLLHGWAMDHRIFRYQIDALARSFTVVALDRRGFGRSSGAPDLNRELDDLDVVADELLAGDRFHLLGMSQGGRIALRFAATRPERLRSLVLQGAPIDGDEPSGPGDERIPLEEYAALARSGRLDELRERWLGHPMMRVGDGAEEAERLLREMLADYSGADLVRGSRDAGIAADLLRTLADLELPVLVLTGRRETESRRRSARRLVETLRHAREVVLHDSGHLCNLTEPESYNAAVIGFCRRVDGAATRSGAGAED